MKYVAVILIGVLYFGCKQETAEPQERHILDSLGLEDYRAIVRHPISLSDSTDSTMRSQIEFDASIFEFDTVTTGEVVRKTFEFTNTGSKPLYILDTRVSCGCTVADYPETAIEPGDKNRIEIEFNTEGKLGNQEKSVVVLSNSFPNESRLLLKGYVKKESK